MLKVDLSAPFILTTTLGGRFSYYPHCTEAEAEPLRGYYFPRPRWYRVQGFESILWVFLFVWPCLAACRILVPQSGLEPMLPAVEGQSTTGQPGKSPNLHFKELDCPSWGITS